MRICSWTKIRVLNVNVGSEISYDTNKRNFEKFQNEAARLRSSILGVVTPSLSPRRSYLPIRLIYSLVAHTIKVNIISFTFEFPLRPFRILRLTFRFTHRTNRCISMNKFLTRVTSFHRWWLLSSRSLRLVFRELINLNESR